MILHSGGGAYGYSAGVSASHHSTEETKKLVKKQSDTKRMVITYNVRYSVQISEPR